MYIVIEGQDATGKSTQVEMMAEYLRKKRKKVITLHEPDGTLDSMHELRKIIKDKRYDLDPLTHVYFSLPPAMNCGRSLLCQL